MSASLIRGGTAAVIEEVKSWQSLPLEELCPIIYLDALSVNIDGYHPFIDQCRHYLCSRFRNNSSIAPLPEILQQRLIEVFGGHGASKL